MKAEEKVIILGTGKFTTLYQCPNCNRKFQIKSLGNRKNYECPKCKTVLSLTK